MPSGPGPMRPAATAVLSCRSVSTWRRTTKSLRTMGSDAKPLNDVNVAFTSKRYRTRTFMSRLSWLNPEETNYRRRADHLKRRQPGNEGQKERAGRNSDRPQP